MASAAADCSSAESAVHVVAVANDELSPAHIFRHSAALNNYTVHLMLINRSNVAERLSPHSQKPRKLLHFLRSQCPRTVVMLVDAFDVFFHRPASIALHRFQQMRSDIVWSTEAWFSDQDKSLQPFFDELAADAERAQMHLSHGSVRSTEATEAKRLKYRYINAGAVIGYANALLPFATAALAAIPERDRRCGKPQGRRCGDQWLYGWALQQQWARWNASLDYANRLFYTAVSLEWSPSTAKAWP